MASGGFLQGLAEELTRQQKLSQEKDIKTAAAKQKKLGEKTRFKSKQDAAKALNLDENQVKISGVFTNEVGETEVTVTEKTGLETLTESFSMDSKGNISVDPEKLGVNVKPTGQPTPPTTPSAAVGQAVQAIIPPQQPVQQPAQQPSGAGQVPQDLVGPQRQEDTPVTPTEKPSMKFRSVFNLPAKKTTVKQEVDGKTFTSELVASADQIRAERGENRLLLLDPNAQIEFDKQIAITMEKARLKSALDLRNADFKIDNTFDSFVDTVNSTFELTGIKPGPLNGLVTQVLGRTRANEFFAGFKGGLVEYAAAVGRISIPGARATRLISLFRGTAPSTFDTIESGIQTTADSFRNAISGDMASNPEAYLPGYDGSFEDREKLKLMLRNFESTLRDSLLKRVFDKNRELLSDKTQSKFDKEVRNIAVKNPGVPKRKDGKIVARNAQGKTLVFNEDTKKWEEL